MILDILRDAILANIGPLRPAPKNWNKRCCMLCQARGHGKDIRNRFGIQFNVDSIALNCFNCGFSAGYTEGHELSKSFRFFLTHLHINEKFIEQIEFEIFKQRNHIDAISDRDNINPEIKLRNLLQQWTEIELPKDSLSLKDWIDNGLDDSNFLSVVEYAINRRLFSLDKFYWSPIKTNNLNKRLIIPYYYKRKLVGFTARLCFDIADKSIPKYYQQCPLDFVYNLDSQHGWSRKYAIVTEGVLDAWTVDGLGILGEIGQTKIDIINRLQKNIIVCPDRDKKGKDLVDAAIENNWAVSFPKWDNNIKDAAAAAEKYGRLLTTQSIISSSIENKDKIKLRWQIEQNARQRKR